MTKTWFITGASKGFGREWADATLEREDKVAATARKLETLDALVDTYGDAVLPIQLDAFLLGEHLFQHGCPSSEAPATTPEPSRRPPTEPDQ